MMFSPHVDSLTDRACAPRGTSGLRALHLEKCAGDALVLQADFEDASSVPVRVTSLGGGAFLLECGTGPWPAHEPLADRGVHATPHPARACSPVAPVFVQRDGAWHTGDCSFSHTETQWDFCHASGARLATVGADYNVGNVPVRFALFCHGEPCGSREGPGRGLGVSFDLSHGTLVYGAGEDFGTLVKNGRLFDFVNADALGVNGRERYQSTPTFHSNAGWSVTLLSREPSHADVGGTRSEVFTLASSAPRLRLLVQMGGTPLERVAGLRALLGGVAGVPAWSLGLWLSRCFYKDQAEVDSVLAEAKAHDFRAGVVNLDARCWMRARTRTDFVWDTSRFEPMESYVGSLRARGFEVCLWENPYVSCATESVHADGVRNGFFAKTAASASYPLQWVPEGLPGFPKPPDAGLVDFTNPSARAWWKDFHRPFLRAGVRCFKTDFGEEIPFDARFADGSTGYELRNAYADLYNECVFEVIREECGEEGIVWARSGWLSTFKTPVKWGGDSQTTWRALRGSLRAALSQAAGGALFWSYDIGGFYGDHPTPEFFLRSFQMGQYFSHARCHGITAREPWAFGERVERLCRTALEARLALLPYLQDTMAHAARRAENPLLPLWMKAPGDRAAAYVDDVFFVGEDLVVAPFLEEGPGRAVYLPQGEWRDLRTPKGSAALLPGGRWLTVPRAAHTPAFVRVESRHGPAFEAASALYAKDSALT